MAAFTPLLGNELLTKDGVKKTEDVVGGKKYVLVYFSAHWCPPCRRFTPVLAEYYKKNAAAMDFELVFCSLDNSEDQFNEYYGSMPWNAIPFKADKPVRKFCGEGIPDLCVFNAEGKVVGKGLVGKVQSDPEGFPWAAPTWAQALGTEFVNQSGSKVPVSALEGKTVGIYCSAEWCPPCRQFTPKLKTFYEEYKKQNKDFEIIFCSSDKSEGEMKNYFKSHHGDYLCYEYSSNARLKMKSFVNASGIPTFAVYDKNGNLINKDGRTKVNQGAAQVLKNGWEPPLVGNLADGTEAQGVDINSCASVIVRCEQSDDDEQEAAQKALEEVAGSLKVPGEEPEVIFFISKKPGGIADQLGALTAKNGSSRCKNRDENPLVMLFDIGNDGAFYESPMTDVTAENIKAFIADFKASKLERKQLEK